jgi:Phage capsid family
MSTAYLRRLIEERAGLTDAGQSILDTCAQNNTDPSPEQRAQLDRWRGQIETLDAEIASLDVQVRANQRFAGTIGRLDEIEERGERLDARRRQAPVEVARSVGQVFTESEQFTEYRGRGTMPAVEFPNFLGFDGPMRAAAGGDPAPAVAVDGHPILLGDPATAGSLVNGIPAYGWGGPAVPNLRTPLLSLLNREPVSSGAVDYITWSEATGAEVVKETEVKPEATLTAKPESKSLETIAYWKGITRQAIEDIPRIQSIVEGKLRRGLARKLQAEAAKVIMAGVGAPGAGLVNLGGIRTAKATIEDAGYDANAILLNPLDHAALDMSIMGGTLTGPAAFAAYWGLTPVSVSGITAGTAVVGSISDAVTWFDRNTTSVYMSDSHADYFVRNMFVILAEARALFAVTEAAALASVKIDTAALAAKPAA